VTCQETDHLQLPMLNAPVFILTKTKKRTEGWGSVWTVGRPYCETEGRCRIAFFLTTSHAGKLSPPVTGGVLLGSTCTTSAAVTGQNLPQF
jgi:hypothetical protein